MTHRINKTTSKPKLFGFHPHGTGSDSYYVLAHTMKEAMDCVKNYLKDNKETGKKIKIDNGVFPKWTDISYVIISGIGEVIHHENA